MGIVAERIGVQSFSLQELVARAVQRIGSALGGNVQHAAAAVPVLRVVAACVDLEFLHGIHGRHKRDGVQAGEASKKATPARPPAG